jgi:hypothetical protein
MAVLKVNHLTGLGPFGLGRTQAHQAVGVVLRHVGCDTRMLFAQRERHGLA